MATDAPPVAPTSRPGGPRAVEGARRVRIGIEAHALSEVRTGISNYVANLVDALGRVAGDAPIGLYLHTPPQAALRFPTVVVPRSPAWTSVRLAAHFALRPAPEVMLYPAQSLPLHSPARNVVTVHDLAFERFPEHFPAAARARWRVLTRHAARRADHLIADSESTRRDLVELLRVPEDRVTVVHLGYDPARFRPRPPQEIEAVRRRYGLERPYVLAVGTLQSRKNHISLIRALRVLRDRGVDVDLAVSGGEGWLFDAAVRVVDELGVREHVHFLASVPDADLPALYGGAVAGALVALYEGFGLPVLESLGCGTPMLVSNVSSLPEVGGDAVLYAEPLDVEAIAHGLQRLIEETDLRAALAARAGAHLASFSWDRTARETLAVLEGVR